MSSWTTTALSFLGSGGVLGGISMALRWRDNRKTTKVDAVDRAMRALEIMNERQGAELERVYHRNAELEDENTELRGAKVEQAARISQLEAELATHKPRRGK